MKQSRKSLGAKKTNIISYTITMKIKAPLDYAFKWCTDFDEGDTKITQSDSNRVLIEKKTDRVIYVMLAENDGNTRGRAYIVRLKPPNSWNMKAYGNGSDSTGEYKLTRISPDLTKLTVTFAHNFYDVAAMPAKSKKKLDSQATWNKYISALETDYRNLAVCN